MTENKKQTEQNKSDQTPVGVIASPEIQKGVYSNLALIHNTENEFILDFMFRVNSNPQLVSRVILSPDHMEKLIVAMNDNIEKYKQRKNKKS